MTSPYGPYQELADRIAAECREKVERINAETEQRMQELEHSSLPRTVVIEQIVEVAKDAMQAIADAHLEATRHFVEELRKK